MALDDEIDKRISNNTSGKPYRLIRQQTPIVNESISHVRLMNNFSILTKIVSSVPASSPNPLIKSLRFPHDADMQDDPFVVSTRVRAR